MVEDRHNPKWIVKCSRETNGVVGWLVRKDDTLPISRKNYDYVSTTNILHQPYGFDTKEDAYAYKEHTYEDYPGMRSYNLEVVTYEI